MYSKTIVKAGVLAAVLAVSVFVLFAQIGKKPAARVESPGKVEQPKDTTPVIDNTEGLAELDKIMKRYEDGNLLLSGEINYYESGNRNEPAEKTSFISITTAVASSYEVDSVQTVSADGVVVMIDKKEKTIAIVEREPELAPATNNNMIGAIREFKEYIYSIQVRESGNDKIISIEFDENSPANTQSYEVVYDPQTYRVKKVRMEIAEGEITADEEDQKEEDELVLVDVDNKEIPTGYYVPEVKVNVLEVIYKMEKKADASLIDMRKLVVKGAEGYEPAERYKHYELLN